jgi:hypothetical protein
MKKTYKDLIDVMNIISGNVGEATTKGQKKLFKIYEKLKPLYEKYNDAREDIRMDGASVDDKGNLTLNEKGDYKYTKEAAKEVNKKLKDLLNVEVEFKAIEIVNPGGLEDFVFLEGWVNGVKFNIQEDEEL